MLLCAPHQFLFLGCTLTHVVICNSEEHGDLSTIRKKPHHNFKRRHSPALFLSTFALHDEMHSNSIVPNESLTKSGESVLLKLEPSRSSHSKALNFTFDDKTVFPEPSRLGENSDYQVPSKSILKRKSSSFQYNVSFNCVDVREYDRTVGDNVRIVADHLCFNLILMK